MVKPPDEIQPVEIFVKEIAPGMNTSVLIDYTDFSFAAEGVDLVITDARSFCERLFISSAFFISSNWLIRKRCLISICE